MHVRAGRNRLAILFCLLVLAGATIEAQTPPPGATPRPEGPPGIRGGTTRPGMPSRDPAGRPAATGTAVIRGRATASTGLPLRRVAVRLMAPGLRQPRLALTDADGRFEFRELPAARYSVMASKGGYVPAQYGQRQPGEAPGRQLELADGQVVENIELVLSPGGVIVGRVVDEFGEPVADAFVAAQRYGLMNGRRRLVPAGRSMQSNDVGQYRIHGLPPGSYYVSASFRGEMSGGEEMGSGEMTGYVPTYFPGTPSPSDAQRVRVEAGMEVMADIQLVPTKVSQVSGIVVDSAGRPATDGMVMAQARGDFPFGPGNSTQIRQGGAFTLNGLAPGTYDLQVRLMDRDRTSPGRPPFTEFGVTTVTVAGEHIAGLRITTGTGLTVPGRVMFDGGPPPAADGIRVMTQPDGEPFMMMGGMSSSTVRPDGTFVLEQLFGARRIVVAVPRGWMLRSISYRGADVTESAVNFTDTSEPGRLDVVLTNRVTTVTGSVTDGGGRAVTEYQVLVFPEDREKLQLSSRRMRGATPDQQGVFRLESLPPGEYLAVALAQVDDEQRFDPEFLESLRGQASAFTLREGDTRSLTIRLTAPPQ